MTGISGSEQHSRKFSPLAPHWLHPKTTPEMRQGTTLNLLVELKLGMSLWKIGEIATAILVSTTGKLVSPMQLSPLPIAATLGHKSCAATLGLTTKSSWMLFGLTLNRRLGLFYYTHRIIETLIQGHHLCHEALKQLLMEICNWHKDNFAVWLKH